MAEQSNLTLVALTPVGVSMPGRNPSFLMVDDAGQLYNSRTGAAVKPAARSTVVIANGAAVTGSDSYESALGPGPGSTPFYAGFADVGISAATYGPLTIANYYGFVSWVYNAPPQTTIDNLFGLHIDGTLHPNLVATTRSVGARLGYRSGGATFKAALWLSGDTADTASGIAFGSTGDCSLYRKGSGGLETPKRLWASRFACLSTPTGVVAGPGAGTSPGSFIRVGNDEGFQVRFTTGSPTTTGMIFTVTFGGTATADAPIPVWSPGNAATATLNGTTMPYVTATASTLVLNSGSAALTASTTYSFNFKCTFY